MRYSTRCARLTGKYGHNISINTQVTHEILPHYQSDCIDSYCTSQHLSISKRGLLPYIPSSMSISYMTVLAQQPALRSPGFANKSLRVAFPLLWPDNLLFTMARMQKSVHRAIISTRTGKHLPRVNCSLSRARVWSCVSERDFVEVDTRARGKEIFFLLDVIRHLASFRQRL